METISKGKIIKKAFEADIPKDREQWPEYYKERMDLCAVCEHNTANGGLGKQVEWVAKKTGVHNCNICGCVISKKCWSKNEACGLEEKGLKPKWNRLIVETVKEDLFNVLNKSRHEVNVNLSADGTMFEFMANERYPEDDLKIKFVVECKKNMELKEIHICSCIVSKPKMLAPGIYEVEFEFSKPHNIGRWFKTGSIVFEDPEKKNEDGTPVQKNLLVKFFVPILDPSEKIEENGSTEEPAGAEQKEGNNQPS